MSQQEQKRPVLAILWGTGDLGTGLARRWAAAGYDVVIVETVGVGQSEIAVASMTDMFVLMQLPNAGDDLQAIKKGVMELADLVLINKADIDPDAATRAQAQITSASRGLSSRSASIAIWIAMFAKAHIKNPQLVHYPQ